MNLPILNINAVVSSQGYERVRRVSEDDNSTVPSYEDDEEEGLDEITSREALPKEVRDTLISWLYMLNVAFLGAIMQLRITLSVYVYDPVFACRVF